MFRLFEEGRMGKLGSKLMFIMIDIKRRRHLSSGWDPSPGSSRDWTDTASFLAACQCVIDTSEYWALSCDPTLADGARKCPVWSGLPLNPLVVHNISEPPAKTFHGSNDHLMFRAMQISTWIQWLTRRCYSRFAVKWGRCAIASTIIRVALVMVLHLRPLGLHSSSSSPTWIH